MFVAYILTNQRELKLKLITRRKGYNQIFKAGIHEYEINPKEIYIKYFLFFKMFTWSMYKEGCRKPMSFEDIQVAITQDEIPLDDLTYWENKLKKDQLTKIAEIFAIIAGITGIISAYFVFKMNTDLQDLIEYQHLMGKIVQQMHDFLIPTIPISP